MSTLNDNLLQIYNTKLEIKDAIGTNSDVFAEYPDLIRGIKNGIVPTGTLSYTVPIDMYGPYVADVTSYSYVSVSLGESSAYIYANGEYTPADFGYAAINSNIVVNVPGPSGNKVISYNGNYDISSYASVTVNVPGPTAQIYLSTDYDTETGEFDTRIQLEQNQVGNYVYNIGTLPSGDTVYIKHEIEFDNTSFPINGIIYWDGVVINNDIASYQGVGQLVQFVSEGSDMYVWPDCIITNSTEYDLNNVFVMLEPTETNGVMNMNVFVGWEIPN